MVHLTKSSLWGCAFRDLPWLAGCLPPGRAAMAQQQQQQGTSGASGLSSAPLFAAAALDAKRRAEDPGESESKVARLTELRARLSPLRAALSLPQSPVTTIPPSHVEGSSPSIAPLPSRLDSSVLSIVPALITLPVPPLPSFAQSDQIGLTLSPNSRGGIREMCMEANADEVAQIAIDFVQEAAQYVGEGNQTSSQSSSVRCSRFFKCNSCSI